MPGEALSPQMVHEDLTVMHRNAQRASRIVDQFLELPRHGSRTAAPVDMNALVQDVLLLIGDQMRKSGIKIEMALERTLPSVVGDPVAPLKSEYLISHERTTHSRTSSDEQLLPKV